MSWMFTLLLVVQILSSLTIISLVLLQQGKGADMGAAFGSGASGSVFGASGSANFLSHATAVLAFVFFSATIAIKWIGNKKPADAGVLAFGATITDVSQADGADKEHHCRPLGCARHKVCSAGCPEKATSRATTEG